MSHLWIHEPFGGTFWIRTIIVTCPNACLVPLWCYLLLTVKVPHVLRSALGIGVSYPCPNGTVLCSSHHRDPAFGSRQKHDHIWDKQLSGASTCGGLHPKQATSAKYIYYCRHTHTLLQCLCISKVPVRRQGIMKGYSKYHYEKNQVLVGASSLQLLGFFVCLFVCL